MPTMRIGVLCIQGGFEEHLEMVKRTGHEAVDVRTKADLEGLHGLILPGGESTTIGMIAKDNGLIEPIREMVHKHKLPIFGTCAGMIVLSNNVTDARKDGQALFGGLDTTVRRNGFGRQVNSFENPVNVQGKYKDLIKPSGAEVFIRAPFVEEVHGEAEVVATLTHSFKDKCTVTGEEQPVENKEIVVGVRQGNILAVSFHPELTDDCCWHKFFATMVEQAATEAA